MLIPFSRYGRVRRFRAYCRGKIYLTFTACDTKKRSEIAAYAARSKDGDSMVMKN